MRLAFSIFSLLAGACVAVATENDAVVGTWLTSDGKGKVQIFRNDGKVFGKIVWLREPDFPPDDARGAAGQPKTDRNNPSPLLRNRLILGSEILSSFKHAGGNLWNDGTIYDPENGKTYRCKMTLKSANQLEVRGFIGFSIIGRTVVWTREVQ